MMFSTDFFSCALSPALPTRTDYPVSQQTIFPYSSRPGSKRLFNKQPNINPQTNKFYANFLLGNQTNATWTHPFSVAWARGNGCAKSFGLAISHVDKSQLVFGGQNGTGAANYFFGPVGLQPCILSCAELGCDTSLTADNLQASSCNINLSPAAGAAPLLTFPLVQGMGFLTGIYQNATAQFQSSVCFRGTVTESQIGCTSTWKYKALLEDGTTWIAYTTPRAAFQQGANNSNTTWTTPGLYNGTVQVTKLPAGAPEDVYDQAAGAYPSTCTVAAVVGGVARSAGSNCSYSFSWAKEGISTSPLLMYALPHHVESFDATTAGATKAITLQTTTKGLVTAVLADSWTMIEKVPFDMGFAPWTPETGPITALSKAAVYAINAVAPGELGQDMNAQCNLDSMYFSGKGFAKFATICYVVNDLAKNTQLAQTGLAKLKSVFDIFVTNKQKNPLAYIPQWKTIVSTAGLGGNAGADFGNSFCNDHHFHYCYFVYTAAVIAYLDPAWLKLGTNKVYIDSLARDYASSVNDELFPFSRSFDWYHGHSWAKGLFESADGKDQESTSEDSFSSYALKVWGFISGDRCMECRGGLMLAIQARSFNHYFLMDSANVDQPAQFIGNKVTGILFENKVDHATYFGMNIEYIQGIHMIPLAPCSTLTRRKKFVSEEWAAYFDRGRVDKINGGWRGILYANLAIIDPKTSFNFFNQTDFDASWIDSGASRTWYLAFAAALGGC